MDQDLYIEQLEKLIREFLDKKIGFHSLKIEFKKLQDWRMKQKQKPNPGRISG